MRVGLLLLFLIFSSHISASAQYNHAREWGLKGKVKKLTSIYYGESMSHDGTWVPKDSSLYNYKLVVYFNSRQNIDSIDAYIPVDKYDYLTTRTVYFYDKNERTGGKMTDYLSDLHLHIKYEWIDQRCYQEHATDSTGNNKNVSMVWMNDRFSVIKRENQLIRDGEVLSHAITETKYEENDPGHSVSVTQNKISQLVSSEEEYVELRDKMGNPLKQSSKTAVNTSPALKYFLIEYYE